jgi:uncharacterized protein
MDVSSALVSLAGGLLIGLAVSLLLVANGRVAGISGILGGALRARAGDFGWRAAFLLGLLTAGAVLVSSSPELFAIEIERSGWAVAAAGLLVGFGTRLGSGCTSGHGVCGISRLSPRSLVATVTFMIAGALMVLAVSQFFGGAL